MVTLVPFSAGDLPVAIPWVADFYEFHQSLVLAPAALTEAERQSAARTLSEWQAEGHALYIIRAGTTPVGFLHIAFRGPIVAWLEDIYVAPPHRGQGLAAAAIAQAEAIIRNIPQYTAICIDVVPRNAAALRLYHRLGYTSLSMITLRKELGENPRDRAIQLLGHNFTY